MANQYNFIYEKLVTAEDDVLGLIAYGIYKQHKIEFITKIKEENKREPTQEECNSFFAASTTESQLNNYRNQAEALLSETVANIANEELGRFEDEMVRNYKKLYSRKFENVFRQCRCRSCFCYFVCHNSRSLLFYRRDIG